MCVYTNRVFPRPRFIAQELHNNFAILTNSARDDYENCTNGMLQFYFLRNYVYCILTLGFRCLYFLYTETTAGFTTLTSQIKQSVFGSGSHHDGWKSKTVTL